MNIRGKEYKTYHQLIDDVLAMPKEEQEAAVEEYALQGPYALQNIGYISGYYDRETADKIMEVFKTSHPIFGRRHPSAEEAFEMGKAVMKGTMK